MQIQNDKKMENIIIYPETQKQHDVITAFLEEMKIRFSSSSLDDEILTDWQKERIEKGLADIQEGRVVANSDVRKKARAICTK